MMKSPITGKDMSLVTKTSTMVFRKETFEYSHQSYHCEVSGEYFTTTELDELNLNQVYNQYRDKHNIPFPDEIIDLRNKYSLSANKMSIILGFGVNSYRNYEKGEVPNLANGKLINTVVNSTETFKSLVVLNNELEERDREKVLRKIEVVNEEYANNESEIRFIDYIFGNKLPNNFTGYRRQTMNKLANMVAYFAEKLQPTETALNKLLFYSDFGCYKKTGFSISGSDYMAHNYGPVPVNYASIFEHVHRKGLVEIVHEEYPNGYTGKRYVESNSKKFNPEVFTKKELESLKVVSQIFKNCNATQIKDKSHEEKAWLNNKKTKSIIDYNYAFDLIHID